MYAWFTCFYFAVIFTMLFFCIMFTDYADEWFTRENRHGCFHEMNKIVSLSLEWSFIQNTLNLLNFGIGIKRWVSVYFLLSRGVSQGCRLSPYLCFLGVEILACMIPQDKEIQGIKDFNSEAEISQFADDTSLFWSSCDSAKKVNEVVLLREYFWPKEKPFGFKWPKEPVRALCIFTSYDERQNNNKNFLVNWPLRN